MNMDSPSGAASAVIPVLTHVVPTSDIPAAVLVALDARMAEKASVLALSAELMQNLRPSSTAWPRSWCSEALKACGPNALKSTKTSADHLTRTGDLGFP